MLGLNLVAGVLLLLVRDWLNVRVRGAFAGDVLVGAVSAALPVVSYFVTPAARPPPTNVNPVLAVMFVSFIWPPHFGVVDPFLPWLPVVLLGALLARRTTLSSFVLAMSGAALVALFLVLRLPYALTTTFRFGSFRPIEQPLTFYSFMGLSKYPPSLTFLCFFLSVDLLFLAAMRLLPEGAMEWPVLAQFVVLGTAPLFFYCLHLLVFGLLAAPFAPEFSTTLAGIYLLWAMGIALCYFPTQMYAKFKMGTPKDSIWRFF